MTAYFAGGCFWCMAKPYNVIKGVTKVISGFCGGNEENPTYEQVKHQETNHRETVEITFDENVVTFHELLSAYFYNIDPFDDGGQFIDRGHSYTCAIYYVNEEQKSQVLKAIASIEEKYKQKVCVSVEPFLKFYPAEEYHQDFALKNKEAYKKEYIESGRADIKEEDKIKL